jgi:penicillin amidase
VGVFGVIIIVLLAAFFFLRYQIRKSFPQVSGEIGLPGLHQEVLVHRDSYGMPVLEAKDEHDLLMALGYVHAQDRLWQMDLGRRAGQGRLSEIFGVRTVPFDRMFRIVGIATTAARVEESLTPASKARLEAYAEGVNQYLVTRSGMYPVEFDLLNYEPEPWQPVHSLILAQMMAWELNLAWWTDLTLGAIAGKVGLEKALDIFPTYPSDVPPLVAQMREALPSIPAEEMMSIAAACGEFTGMRTGQGGSNAWVIAPPRSASGAVILANDPHLRLHMPSKWYQVHLRAPGYDVGGMSIPGVPGIVIGRNRDLAWGLTAAMADEADFYIEQVDSSDTTRYLYDGTWRSIQLREEQIPVRDDTTVTLIIRSTHHGPIVTDVRTELQKATSPYVAAMRWTGYETADRIEAFRKINVARNHEEFAAGVREFTTPGQSFVYGDREGNIGYWLGALVPVRGKQNSTLPLPGWDPAAEWRGFVPFSQMPHFMNPPEGFIATANNKITASDYPYHISDLWEPSTRFERLRRTLAGEGIFSAEDFERLQVDEYSAFARDVASHLQLVLADSASADPGVVRFADYLRNWDFVFRKDDIATAIYQVTFERLLRRLYLDEMGDDLFHDWCILSNIPLRVTQRLLDEGTSPWFDDITTPRVELMDDILRLSVSDALAVLRVRFGDDAKNWRWGELHRVTLQHPFGLQKPLDKIFNVGPFSVGGGHTALVSAEYDLNEPFDVTVGSSFRMIVDLSRPGELRSVLPSGQSGQVFTDHYADQTPLWLRGFCRTVQTDSAAVRSPGWTHLTLTP